MSVSVVCPHCASRLTSATAPPPGKGIKCPKCGKGFRYDPNAVAATPPPLPSDKPQKGSGGKVFALLVALLLLAGGAGAAWWFGLLPGLGRGGSSNDQAVAGAGGIDASPEGQKPAVVEEPVTDLATPAIGGADQSVGAAVPLQLPAEFNGEDGGVAMALSPDARTVALAGTTIVLRDLATGQVMHKLTFNINYADPTLLTFSPDGRHLAASALDGGKVNTHNGAIWGAADGKQVVAFELIETNPRYLMPMVFSPKGTYAAYPGQEHDIIVYDLRRGREHARLQGHTAWPGAMVFSADEARLFSASQPDYTDLQPDRSLRMWDLSKPGESEILQKEEHVLPLAVTPDGKTLFTYTTGGGEVQEWEVRDQGPAVLQHRLNESVAVARLSPDAKELVVSGGSHTVRWDIAGRKEIGRPLQRGGMIAALSSDTRTLVVGAGPAVSLWDVATGQKQQDIIPESHPGDVRSVIISADGAVVGATYTGGGARLWPAGGRVTEARATLASRSGVRALRFSTDGKSLVATLFPNAVKDPQTDFPLRRDLEEFEKAWDKRREVYDAKRLEILELATGKDDAAREPLRRRFEQEVARPAREFLATGLQSLSEKHRGEFPPGEVAEVWNLATGKEVATLTQPALAPEEAGKAPANSKHEFEYGPLVGLSELPDTAPQQPTPLASLAKDRIVWVHRQQGLKTLDVVSAAETSIGKPITKIDMWLFSPDGKTLFVKGQQQTAVTRVVKNTEPGKPDGSEVVMKDLPVAALVDVTTGKARPLTAAHFGNSVNPAGFPPGQLSACFTPGGDRLLAIVEPPSEEPSPGVAIKTWDVATVAEVGKELLVNAQAAGELRLSPDGKTLALVKQEGGRAKELGLYDLASGRELPVTIQAPLPWMAFSPDSKTLAVIEDAGNGAISVIHLIDLTTNRVRAKAQGWERNAHALAFSPDGRLLAVAGGDSPPTGHDSAGIRTRLDSTGRESELKLFDSTTGALAGALAGHDDVVICLAFSPDGRTLASGSFDRTVKLWDVAAAVDAAKLKVPQVAVTVPAKPAPTAARDRAPPSSKTTALASASRKSVPPTAKGATGSRAPSGTATSDSRQRVETNSIGMKLVVLPAGSFRMGAPESDPNAQSWERPAHTVKISKPFAIGIHEVTVGQFRQFVDETGYQTEAEADGSGGYGYDAAAKTYSVDRESRYSWRKVGWTQTDSHPVVNVTWNDAKAFCVWLSGKERRRYRLPTEAEWEYACRAGTKTRFWTGDEDSSVRGAENFADISLRSSWEAATWVQPWHDGYAFTAPVGTFKPNPWGLFDMHGNTIEWMADHYEEGYYASSPDTDPRGPSTGAERVWRSGSWYFEPRHARTTARTGSNDPDFRDGAVGFRVARDE